LFADNFDIGASGPVLEDIAAKLNQDLKHISKWAKRKHLKISTEKSQVSFFTPWNREKVFPTIFYEGIPIPVTNLIKSLGINFDRDHAFTSHLKFSSSKGRDRVSIVKAVIGPSSLCFSKENGLLRYKALVSPVLGYGAPIFLPPRLLLKQPLEPLQKVQNVCLHAVTGCHSASSIQHLHNECKMLQVHDHLKMQCHQFLLNTRQVSHPSHLVTSRPLARGRQENQPYSTSLVETSRNILTTV
jgi:hypothetical protein